MTSLVRSSRDSMTSLFTLHVVFKGVAFKSKYLENLICQNGTKTNSIQDDFNSAPQSLEYFYFHYHFSRVHCPNLILKMTQKTAASLVTINYCYSNKLLVFTVPIKYFIIGCIVT